MEEKQGEEKGRKRREQKNSQDVVGATTRTGKSKCLILVLFCNKFTYPHTFDPLSCALYRVVIVHSTRSPGYYVKVEAIL